MKKSLVIVSLHNNVYPLYLALGKAPLFDNFQITGVDFHFSMNLSTALRYDSENDIEVWVRGILHSHPRFGPLSFIPVFDPGLLL